MVRNAALAVVCVAATVLFLWPIVAFGEFGLWRFDERVDNLAWDEGGHGPQGAAATDSGGGGGSSSSSSSSGSSGGGSGSDSSSSGGSGGSGGSSGSSSSSTSSTDSGGSGGSGGSSGSGGSGGSDSSSSSPSGSGGSGGSGGKSTNSDTPQGSGGSSGSGGSNGKTELGASGDGSGAGTVGSRGSGPAKGGSAFDGSQAEGTNGSFFDMGAAIAAMMMTLGLCFAIFAQTFAAFCVALLQFMLWWIWVCLGLALLYAMAIFGIMAGLMAALVVIGLFALHANGAFLPAAAAGSGTAPTHAPHDARFPPAGPPATKTGKAPAAPRTPRKKAP